MNPSPRSPDSFHEKAGMTSPTHQIEITGGSNHGATILAAPRRSALPPGGRPSLPPLGTHTLQIHQGIPCDRALPTSAQSCGVGGRLLKFIVWRDTAVRAGER